MLFKLFRKSPSSSTPATPVAADLARTEDLERRINAIDFKPSKGFLKDQQQPKRYSRPPAALRR